MVLAEALLRVPDATTADRLIEDKLAAGHWLDGDVKSTALWCRPRPGRSGSRRASSIRARRRRPSSRPSSSGSALPAVRAATRQAMRLIGSHFVLGQTIEEALARARGHGEFRYSFDMLGEGARTATDADTLFRRLCRRDRGDRRSAGKRRLAGAAGHFGQASRRCIRAIEAIRASACGGACRRASPNSRAWRRPHDLNFTIDAEEADRLELSLDVDRRGARRSGAERIGERVRPGGAGLSEARAGGRCDWPTERRRVGSRLTVRLVKGAYWDTEIKRAQERGLPRLSGVHPQGHDRSLLPGVRAQACSPARARILSAIRHPQRAHRRQHHRGCRRRRAAYEFQRLHGMGEALYETRCGDCRTPPAASMRRSAVTAIFLPIWCGACSKTAPTRPSSRSRPIRTCRSTTFCAARTLDREPARGPQQKFRCHAISIGRNGATRSASNSAIA